jgi:hypothetical protein
MGRDSKGRLGTFEYLMNPAISCLDFSLEGKRVVRARCGIALLEDKSGGKYPILFVDGVEGSNQVPNKVILRAIQEYAHSIHVKGVYINAHAHNVVPKRFIRSVKDAGYTVGAAKIEFLDTQSRQYLDAFGTPIQPFEYALPVGRVVGYFIPSGDPTTISLGKPSAVDKLKTFVRMHSYWIFFGQALAGAPILTAQTSPLASALLVAGALGAGATQLLFQRRSLRTSNKRA